MTLVLFPLSAHLLPGGIMPLRIFEPRYQRMIAESREREFALCMLDPRQPDALRNMYPLSLIHISLAAVSAARLARALSRLWVRGRCV